MTWDAYDHVYSLSLKHTSVTERGNALRKADKIFESWFNGWFHDCPWAKEPHGLVARLRQQFFLSMVAESTQADVVARFSSYEIITVPGVLELAGAKDPKNRDGFRRPAKFSDHLHSRRGRDRHADRQLDIRRSPVEWDFARISLPRFGLPLERTGDAPLLCEFPVGPRTPGVQVATNQHHPGNKTCRHDLRGTRGRRWLRAYCGSEDPDGFGQD